MSNKSKRAYSYGQRNVKESASHRLTRIIAIILSALMCVGALTYIIFAIVGLL